MAIPFPMSPTTITIHCPLNAPLPDDPHGKSTNKSGSFRWSLIARVSVGGVGERRRSSHVYRGLCLRGGRRGRRRAAVIGDERKEQRSKWGRRENGHVLRIFATTHSEPFLLSANMELMLQLEKFAFVRSDHEEQEKNTPLRISKVCLSLDRCLHQNSLGLSIPIESSPSEFIHRIVHPKNLFEMDISRTIIDEFAKESG
ncbi:hypothetical protein F5878DRAFT_8975 [Lentinula raphanica]|uniref:Uncharacterized protein n=1 Tax=Lentinula raphanica TaxID=153919 RepID=A0AA38U580_9AGAR|nr:hypothetical protein F5878DRAFT_8975 [Lentinula raphanica]